MSILALLTLVPWAVAAYFDWRYRRAPNYLWAAVVVLGLAGVVTGSTSWLSVAFAAVVLPAVAVAMWHGGMVGGADAKAMLVLPVYGVLSFSVVGVFALFMVPFLVVRDDGEPIPMLIPLGAAVWSVLLVDTLWPSVL